MEKSKTTRCAVYTRKSVEEGLEMEFNSLDAQRLSAENYIASQRMNGWVCLPERYDDGGFSGGTLDRPAMKRLLADAEAGKLDLIVVYKIDRLSRSICDFAELSRKFDAWGVSFVSVTQDINTATSSGRMMLNILVTFAQYEREVIAERIRDKMSASRKRGQWVGGTAPFGYKVENKRLVPDPAAKDWVAWIFELYGRVRQANVVARELNDKGVKTRSGHLWTTVAVHNLLRNRTYIGEVLYQGKIYKGEHDGIIDRALWEEVQSIVDEKGRNAKRGRPEERDVPLKGLLRCGHCGGAMTPTYSRRGGKKYCYYICTKDTKRDVSCCPVRRIPAGDIENTVVQQVGEIIREPSMLTKIARELDEEPRKTMETLNDIGGFWSQLYPAEQCRLLRLLVKQVTVDEDGIAIEVMTSGMRALMKEVTDEND